MGKHFLLLISLLALSLLGISYASVSPEAYWKLMLPSTPMPQNIKDSLPPGASPALAGEEGSDEKLGRKGLFHPSTTGTLSTTTTYGAFLSYAKGSLTSTSTDAAYKGLSCTKCSLTSTIKDPKVSSNVQDSDHLANHFFFLEKNIQIGTKMNLDHKKGTMKALYLPRQVANTIPFSSNKLQEIIRIFSLDPKSDKASVLQKRLELCEEPTIQGVEKQCATSLESMIDFVASKIGKKNVKAISSKVEKEADMKEYTITRVNKLTHEDHETVVCHKVDYPYALHFCHTTNTIRSYMVSLVGEDGEKIEAVAACHKETNAFLENYAINVLNVEPGSVRICHFPPAEDSIIWVRD